MQGISWYLLIHVLLCSEKKLCAAEYSGNKNVGSTPENGEERLLGVLMYVLGNSIFIFIFYFQMRVSTTIASEILYYDFLHRPIMFLLELKGTLLSIMSILSIKETQCCHLYSKPYVFVPIFNIALELFDDALVTVKEHGQAMQVLFGREAGIHASASYFHGRGNPCECFGLLYLVYKSDILVKLNNIVVLLWLNNILQDSLKNIFLFNFF